MRLDGVADIDTIDSCGLARKDGLAINYQIRRFAVREIVAPATVVPPGPG
jgi:hypothetical protein